MSAANGNGNGAAASAALTLDVSSNVPHRLYTLRCSECNKPVGSALPEAIGAFFLLCEECTPTHDALKRDLTPTERAAVRVELARREASEAERERQRAKIAELSASIDGLRAQVDMVRASAGQRPGVG